MKKFTRLAFALFFLTIIGTSCNKDDDTVFNNTFTVKIDGTTWDAGANVVATNLNGELSVTATKGLEDQIVLAIVKFDGLNEYKISADTSGNINSALYLKGAEKNPFVTMDGNGEGSINITSFEDDVVKANFSFTAQDSTGKVLNFTDGSFKVKLAK